MTALRKSDAPSVLIIGAGIGGLTTAAALRSLGVQVVVVEQATELREVGAGISLWPNAVHALRRIGLGDAAEAVGSRVDRSDLRDWRGRLLHSSAMQPMEDRYGAPVVMIHRADLHLLLRGGLDATHFRLGARCVALEQDADGVSVTLADGEVLRGDVAVGADGLRSAVRAATLGDGPPRFSGFTAWRAVVEVDAEVARLVTGSESWGRGSIFGMQRLFGNLVYWYAATRAPEGGAASPAHRRQDLLDRFRSWHAPVPQLIGGTAAHDILRNDLYDRRPPNSLAYGRVALLGDAAHPMLPYLGQGACQAIADGVALAYALAESADASAALRAYSERRLSQATAAVEASRRVARVAHLQSPIGVALRWSVLKVTPPNAALKQMQPILAEAVGSGGEHSRTPAEAVSRP